VVYVNDGKGTKPMRIGSCNQRFANFSATLIARVRLKNPLKMTKLIASKHRFHPANVSRLNRQQIKRMRRDGEERLTAALPQLPTLSKLAVLHISRYI